MDARPPWQPAFIYDGAGDRNYQKISHPYNWVSLGPGAAQSSGHRTDIPWKLPLRVCWELVLSIPEGRRPRTLLLPSSTQGMTRCGCRGCLHLCSHRVFHGFRRLCSQGGPFLGQIFYLKKCAFWGTGLSSIELNSEGNKTQFFKNPLFF